MEDYCVYSLRAGKTKWQILSPSLIEFFSSGQTDETHMKSSLPSRQGKFWNMINKIMNYRTYTYLYNPNTHLNHSGLRSRRRRGGGRMIGNLHTLTTHGGQDQETLCIDV